jgi:ubiquinone/menaquinone biosynthesis C-methylase UbiE
MDGVAECLPVGDSSFDIVRASSVIEHVDDAAAAFKEAYRVLKPGGAFWFLTASSLCPRQGEIRGFPFFGWYPNGTKLKIMKWATSHRPDLIGFTQRPAIHWFTPAKARRMLNDAGFTKVYDRWDLRLPGEGGRAYQIALSIVKLGFATKFVADVALPCCSYAAIK